VTARQLLLQVPSIETCPAVVTAQVDDILGYRWEDSNEVIDPLCDALAQSGAIGIDGMSAGLRYGIISLLQERLGASRFTEGGFVLDRIRIVKSEAELACLKLSAAMTSAGLEAAIDAVCPGTTDNDIAAEGARALLAAGSEFMNLQAIVTSGKRSSIIHVNHRRNTIARDESVFLEFGSAYHRYTAPMMRTAVAGKASDDMKAVADLCRQLFEALCAAMVPGKAFDEAAAQAETVLAQRQADLFFSGVYGYSVGAQFPPSWVEGTGYIARGQSRVFEENMVFHLPLCLRLPGQWGIGLSDTVLVTQSGAIPITDNDWQLHER
jgi:Xaa-Pro aminopeptidase